MVAVGIAPIHWRDRRWAKWENSTMVGSDELGPYPMLARRDAEWLSLGPQDAPPRRPEPRFNSENVVSYRVDGDWRRNRSGDWYRWVRFDLDDGRTEYGLETSPLADFMDSEEHGWLPIWSVIFGPPTGVGAAVALVAVRAVSPLTAEAAGVAGIPVGVVAGFVVPDLLAAAARRLEAPGNLVWRHGARVVIVSARLSWLLPAVMTTAAAVAFARLTKRPR